MDLSLLMIQKAGSKVPISKQFSSLIRTCTNASRHRKLKLDSKQSPAPEPLISMHSLEGKKMLKNAILCPATSHICETQIHPAYCGLASSSVILQSFNLKNFKQTEILDPLKTHTPFNWFETFGLGILDLRCIPNLWKYHLSKFLIYDGISISGICMLLQLHSLEAKPFYFNQTNLPEFRKFLLQSIQPHSKTRLLTSLHRGVLGQRGTGHFSVVVGYHEESDKVLLNEVNQKRYPNVWVETKTLWDAICTETFQKKPRGYIVVTKKDSI